jgi:hypothetical protein
MLFGSVVIQGLCYSRALFKDLADQMIPGRCRSGAATSGQKAPEAIRIGAKVGRRLHPHPPAQADGVLKARGDLTSFAIRIGSWWRTGFETQRGPCGDGTHPTIARNLSIFS